MSDFNLRFNPQLCILYIYFFNLGGNIDTSMKENINNFKLDPETRKTLNTIKSEFYDKAPALYRLEGNNETNCRICVYF